MVVFCLIKSWKFGNLFFVQKHPKSRHEVGFALSIWFFKNCIETRYLAYVVKKNLPARIPTVTIATPILGENTDDTKPVVKNTPPEIIAVLQLYLLIIVDESGAEVI